MSSPRCSLDDALDGLLELRPFPAAASRLISACDSDDTDANAVSEIIKYDPALSLKILQVANSPIYGYGGEIRTVDHAAVVLGFRSLREIAVSMAVGQVFDNGSPTTRKARQDLWEHAMSCGTVARTLAKVTGLAEPDEAFLAGLVHDVGKLFFYDFHPDEYAQIVSLEILKSSVEAEQDAFGVAHTQVGMRCGQNWELPDEINDVISYHHDPAGAEFSCELVELIAVANSLSKLWCQVRVADSDTTPRDILLNSTIEFSPSQVDEIEKLAVSELEAVHDAYC